MKKILPFIKIIILWVAMLATIGYVSGYLTTKQLLFQNSYQWSKSISNGTEVRIVDTRNYEQYYVILGTYDNNQAAYLSSYQKLPVVPLYTRHLLATNKKYGNFTGIGFKLHGKFVQLLISPPYTDILMRNENGVLCPAPETMY